MDVDDLQVFVGNPDVFAEQNEDGSYTPVRRPIGEGDLDYHLSGERTLGTYVNDGELARFVVFDVDTGDDAMAQAERIVDAVKEMGVRKFSVGIEFSGRKGYHVWVPLGGWIPAADLRRFGRGVLALADVECEVFPKQDVVKDLGNLIKLPGGKHRVSGMASEWVTEMPVPLSIAKWTTDVQPNLPAELAGRRFTTGASERFPCMEAIQNEGCQEGSRNNQLFHLATMLRRAGATSEYVAMIVRDVNEKGDPLDPYEVENLLGAAEYAGPVCDQLPEDRKCGELCIRTRTSGLYARPQQLRHAAEGENVVVTLARRTGKTIVLEHDDVETMKGTLT